MASNWRNVEPKVPSSWSQRLVAWFRTLTRTRLTPTSSVAEPLKATGEPTFPPWLGVATVESGSWVSVEGTGEAVVGAVVPDELEVPSPLLGRQVPLAWSRKLAPASGMNSDCQPVAVRVRPTTP